MPGRFLGPPPLPPLSPAALLQALAGLRDHWLRSPLSAADRAALSADTGWDGAHLDEAVRRAFAPFTDRALARLASPAAPGSTPWLLAILAGRIPAPVASSLFHALAARVPLVLKPPSSAAAFARLLVASVARVAPAQAPSVRLLDAAAGDPRLDAAIRGAPACLVHGSDATIDSVLAARAGLPTFPGAHRESVVVAFREALAPAALPALARAIARDAAIYDQGGCLSPVAVLVEESGDWHRLPELLLHGLDAAARAWPPGRLSLADAAAVRTFAEESRLLSGVRGGLVLPGRPGPVPPVVACLPGPLRPAPGFRVLQVVPFASAADLAADLAPLAGRLQGVAVAGPRSRWAAFVADHPSFRPAWLTTPGRLQRPPADWPENGVVLAHALRRL